MASKTFQQEEIRYTQVIPCLADSMARSVSTFGPGPSLAHLTSISDLPIRNPDDALNVHERFFFKALRNKRLRIITTKTDLVPDRRIGVLLGMRYVPDNMTLWHMQKLRAYGLGVMSLGYGKYGSQYCDQSAGRDGLTDKGVELLEWMQQCGILLDVSGTENASAAEALCYIMRNRLSMTPMASHSGCYAISRDHHDLENSLLRGISHMGGYIGIPYTYPEEFVMHAKHAYRTILNRAQVGICSDQSNATHFDMMADLSEEHLDIRIFGENFITYLARALPWE